MKPNMAEPKGYLLDLQDRLCAAVEAVEADSGGAVFDRRERAGENGALARPRVLTNGRVFEQAAVNFTYATGASMPPAASERRPELAGLPFAAVSVSVIFHPINPYAPTTHMNLRFFSVGGDTEGAPGAGAASDPASSRDGSWWFGGGFDLTPYYGFEEDAVFWHRMSQRACEPFGAHLYPELKGNCDAYFFLPHRGEARGLGGLFFDDRTGDFEQEFALWKRVGDHFPLAYLPIIDRRKDIGYGDREREFQLYRRGRYVEFNLLYDRGTRYGLQSGRNIDSVLASLPPLVSWRHGYEPMPGTVEADLIERFLKPQAWV